MTPLTVHLLVLAIILAFLEGHIALIAWAVSLLFTIVTLANVEVE